MLTSKQRSYLRGLAAKEDTILQIGKDGITENTPPRSPTRCVRASW